MNKYTLFIHKQFYIWLNFVLGETKYGLVYSIVLTTLP